MGAVGVLLDAALVTASGLTGAAGFFTGATRDQSGDTDEQRKELDEFHDGLRRIGF
jgi:hypothetical protein